MAESFNALVGGDGMTAQRVKSKLETVEMKLKLSSVPRLPAPMQNNSVKPVVKSNFPLFDNRMAFGLV